MDVEAIIIRHALVDLYDPRRIALVCKCWRRIASTYMREKINSPDGVDYRVVFTYPMLQTIGFGQLKRLRLVYEFPKLKAVRMHYPSQISHISCWNTHVLDILEIDYRGINVVSNVITNIFGSGLQTNKLIIRNAIIGPTGYTVVDDKSDCIELVNCVDEGGNTIQHLVVKP
jgi:hypothetical protein